MSLIITIRNEMIFRLLRKKITIIFSLILIIFIILILLFNNLNNRDFVPKKSLQIKPVSTVSDHESDENTISHRNNHNGGGFASLKRQHKLNEIKKDFQTDEKNAQIVKPFNINTNGHQILDHNHSFNNIDDANFAQPSIENIKCRNTVQGKLLIADDRGQICHRMRINLNGCCDDKHYQTRKFFCDSCKPNDCCRIYEHCVSCCMAPKNRNHLNKLLISQPSKSLERLKIFLSSISDLFELCLVKCRTSSASVLHENTYKDPDAKYCFGLEND